MPYISLSRAPHLLSERRALRGHVEQWWSEMGWCMPPSCYAFDGVLACGRAVATRRYEDVLFCHYAEKLGLRPVWMEHTHGRLSTHSPFKRSLLHPTFYIHRGRSGSLVVKKTKLAPIQQERMRQIHTIKLENGDSLVAYHHRLHSLLGAGEESRVEVSDFYGQFGRASQYYLPYLSLFVAHAVLVDDYHGGEDAKVLGDFTEQIFMPAFRELEQRFRVTPMVARMRWHEHLRYYPSPDIKAAGTLEEVVPGALLSIPQEAQEHRV